MKDVPPQRLCVQQMDLAYQQDPLDDDADILYLGWEEPQKQLKGSDDQRDPVDDERALLYLGREDPQTQKQQQLKGVDDQQHDLPLRSLEAASENLAAKQAEELLVARPLDVRPPADLHLPYTTNRSAAGLLLDVHPQSCVIGVSAFLSIQDLSSFTCASKAVCHGPLLAVALQLDPGRARAPMRLSVRKFQRGSKNAVLVEENRLLVLPLIKGIYQGAPQDTVLALLHAFPAAARNSDADVVASCLREYYGSHCSALHIAAAVGSPEPVLRALARLEPSSLWTPNASGALPLHVAASQRRSTAIRALLEDYPQGAQCVDGSPHGMLPLHVYLWQEDSPVDAEAMLAAVQALVAAFPSSLSVPCSYGLPLHVALQRRSPLALVQWLMEQYPEALATYTPRGDTALHLLCSSKPRAEVARTLLRAQPAAASRRSRGDLPLHAALMADTEPELDFVCLLLESYPAAVHSCSARGKLPLHLAAEAGASLPIVELLLNKFSRAVMIQDARGYLPYHCARMGSVHMGVRRRACLEVVDLLLSHYPEAELQPAPASVRKKDTQAFDARGEFAVGLALVREVCSALHRSAAGHTAVAL